MYKESCILLRGKILKQDKGDALNFIGTIAIDRLSPLGLKHESLNRRAKTLHYRHIMRFYFPLYKLQGNVYLSVMLLKQGRSNLICHLHP